VSAQQNNPAQSRAPHTFQFAGIASAPVSWGIMESCELPPEYPYTRVLDEIAAAGFSGTELGPYAFYPAHPERLRAELQQRGLALCSAFVDVPLANRSAVAEVLDQVERTAALISSAGARVLVLSDRLVPERSRTAGRPAEATTFAWSDAEWNVAAEMVRQVVARCRQYGLEVAFHHHAGTHVETPQEIERLLSLLQPDEMGLCFDTGHFVFCGGDDPEGFVQKHGARIRWLHLKDLDAARADQARQKKMDFHAAVRHGIFAPLGHGSIDFARLLTQVRGAGYQGWVVVEQDVLPGGSDAAAPLANATAAREFLRTLGL
jgi:inosose dehydratase